MDKFESSKPVESATLPGTSDRDDTNVIASSTQAASCSPELEELRPMWMITFSDLVLKLDNKIPTIVLECGTCVNAKTKMRKSLLVNMSTILIKRIERKQQTISVLFENDDRERFSKAVSESDIVICAQTKEQLYSDNFKTIVVHLETLYPQKKIRALDVGLREMAESHPQYFTTKSKLCKTASQSSIQSNGVSPLFVSTSPLQPLFVSTSPLQPLYSAPPEKNKVPTLPKLRLVIPPNSYARTGIRSPRIVGSPQSPFSKPVSPISKITDNLFLGQQAGGADDRSELTRLGITHIINVTTNLPMYFESDERFVYHRVPINDTHNDDIGAHFTTAIDYINRAIDAGGKVLVHCFAGISRSASIVIAYLIKERQMTLEQATAFVKTRRHQIDPNLSFIGALTKYERQIRET